MLQRLRRGDDDGFTLIEVVVALTLFGLLAGTVSLAFGAVLKQTKANQNRTIAANIAQRVIDRVHALEFSDIVLGKQPAQQFRSGGLLFSVVTTTSLVPEGSGGAVSPCDAAGALSATRVGVEVTWAGMGSARPVRSDTVRAQTVQDQDPGKGIITVKVVDRDSQPAPDHVVTLNPGARTFTTGSDGCAVFPLLVPGAYSAALSTPGYVDKVGTAAPVRSVTAVAGTTTKDPGFSYDRAATLATTWTVQAPSSLASFPLLAATGVGLGNSAFLTGVRGYRTCGAVTPCATVTAAGVSVGELFPSVEGYRTWSGACTDAKPAALPPALVLGPAANGTLNVPVAPVVLTLRTSTGLALNGGTVKITHAADSSCATVAASMTAPAGSNVVQLSLPGGTFSFQVGVGAVISVALSTSVPGPTAVTVTSS